MDGQDDTPDFELEEGGPVKNFLDHLEDFRWVLIKSVTALVVAMTICLIGAQHVIAIIKWPMTHDQVVYTGSNRFCRGFYHVYNAFTARTGYAGTNQIALIKFGTNQLAKFELTPEQQAALQPARADEHGHILTNAAASTRFMEVQVEPLTMGSNQVLGWRVVTGPAVEAEARKMRIDLINLHPAGAFFVAVQVAFYGGLVLAAPFILYFIGSFVFPALKINEKKPALQAMVIGGGLFFVGVAFCYFMLMPVALVASQMYSQWLGFGAFAWQAEDYIAFVCKFMLGMGIGFELPVVLLTLVKIGVLNYASLRGMWRYMIVINLVLGALLTTPEVITQVMMAVPLYMLYEVSVWIAWYWEWRDRRRGVPS